MPASADVAAVIDRPRLIRQLDACADRDLTLVVGPAGSGKSTVIDQWAATRDDIAARIDLVSDDVEPLADALAAAPARRSADQRPLVVVDAGPVILSEPQVALLDGLVRRGPDATRLIVAARSTPGFTTGHLVGRDGLGSLGPTDLAFDRSEIAAVARARLGRRLEPDEIAAVDMYGAWVTAVLLTLAAPSVLGYPDAPVSPGRARPLIDDFVVREVLGGLSDAHRALLFDVSGFDVIVPPVADEVLGRDDSRRLLDEITARVTFVQRDADGGFDYRLEADFAATLRREAQRRDPARVRRVARAFADYHLVRGERLDGLAPLAAAGDWDRVIDALGAIIREPLDGHELRRARVLAEAVPPATVRAHPNGLQTMVSLDLVVGDASGADALLGELHDRLTANDADDWADRTFWHAAEAVMGPWRSDPQVPARHAWEALSRLDDYSRDFAVGIDEQPFVWARALVSIHGASSLVRCGRFDTARDWLARGADLAIATGQVELQVFAAGYGAVLDATVGRLAAATDGAARTRALAEQLPGRAVLTLGADHADVVVALEQNRLGAARRHLDAMAATEFPQPTHTRTVVAVLDAQLALASGQLRSGLGSCDRVRSEAAGSMPVDVEPVLTTTEVRLAVRYGQLDHARRLIAETPHPEKCRAASALLCLVEGDDDGLDAALATWAEPVGVRGAIEREVFGAVASDRATDPTRCRAHLLRAAELAGPEGFTRVFFDTAPGVAELIRAQHAADPDPVFETLLARLARDRRDGPSPARPVFTESETEVAELLVTHLGTSEMADRIGVSPSTLKSRRASVYRKLGVHRRSDAVTRLSELGIVRLP